MRACTEKVPCGQCRFGEDLCRHLRQTQSERCLPLPLQAFKANVVKTATPLVLYLI